MSLYWRGYNLQYLFWHDATTGLRCQSADDLLWWWQQFREGRGWTGNYAPLEWHGGWTEWMDLHELTHEEAERQYAEADEVPLSESQIERIVATAMGKMKEPE